ncbi:MAG: rRNA pseudouridine synthase [Ottowia sp.]|nr:rRNA pseudouridine synthase [Ottowia sp.]
MRKTTLHLPGKTQSAGKPSLKHAHVIQSNQGRRAIDAEKKITTHNKKQPIEKANTPRNTRNALHAPTISAEGAQTGVRLSKRMSELGLCSRREAEFWITQNWVKVDGVVVNILGTRIDPNAQIEIEKEATHTQAQCYTVLLHKPMGYVSGQAEDGYLPAATLITNNNRWEKDTYRKVTWPLHKLAPAGRLDIDSTGLLVLTQDGRIARALIGADSKIEKEYLVRVAYDTPTGLIEQQIDQAFPAEQLAQLRHGLMLDGQALKPAKVSWQNGEQLRFVLREGKKRQIRRMCEQVGLRVVALKRVRIGQVNLGHLPVGQWRLLGFNEIF